jgi:hypothetical protein
VAVAVAIAATFITLGASHRTENADPAPLATPLSTPTPTVAPFVKAAPSTPKASSKPTSKAPVRLSRGDAVTRVRAAVEAGRAVGQIRADAATDLLNLLQSLTNADAADVDGIVDDLRRKIRDRVSEGTVAADRATVLQSRLTDLGRAVGT